MNSKKNLKRNLLICLLAGSAVMYTLPLHAATSVIGNNTLPTGGDVFAGDIKIPDWAKPGETNPTGNLEMNIIQSSTNGVIKWESFDVGGSATVNFKGPQVEGGYNTLNYVNAGGSMSQIYGTINANNNGNIFIVNPAGVQIGNSAQINVGSLYVSSNTLSDAKLSNFYDNAGNTGFNLGGTRNADIELMSLGNINAGKVTFEGDGRIVIDSERIKDAAGDEKLNYQNINIKTSETNKNNIIIGYEAYDETITNGSVVGYDNKNTDEVIATVTTENGTSQYKKANGYMWVEDVEQLQAIGKNANTLSGNYALRNSIDATATSSWNKNEGFNPIGLDENGKLKDTGFTGKFDGIDYNIFGLTINNNYTNVGLFGGTNGATINNVTLVGGSIIGGAHVGAVVGSALNGTVITNVVNSASVSGSDNTDGDNIGGVVGVADNSTITNAVNTGAIDGKNNNVGGLVGLLENGSTLDGNSYNLGDVSGDGYNVGGLVGHAENSTIGDGTNLVYNRLDVEGAYNVGGIVGNMEGSTVKYAENSGTVEATGYTTEVYKYHTADNSYDVMRGRNDDDIAEVEVAVANVGGIVGTSSSSDNGSKSAIINVENSGDISSSKNSNNEFYDAGNIGGIIGRANNTDITSATNRENEIRGAHNIGGVAGYLGGNSTVSGGINDGGDIMATGARAAANSSYNVADGPGAGDNNYYGSNVNNNGFALEHVRNGNTGRETFIIGNMGGIVGYMEGKDAKITGSANRGTVHTFDEFEGTVPDYAKAANAGGVVGKIDRVGTLALADLQGKDENNNDKILKAAVSNSYNTGDVMGYSNVGGIVGMMYNGEVAGSYNLGYISTTRQPGKVGGEGYDALNMGGIVGDTTEGTEAEALLYDVYNKGQIGDSTYTYYGRHVAGIVGRLSGDVEKAYNNGAIYNAYAATGGIAGWMYKGSINNAFNTGNITVNNRDSSTSQVGGIVGAVNVGSEEINLTNLYNLGTLRSFKLGSGNNAVGGIVGAIMNYQHNINISNAYTTGNIYVDDYSGNLVNSIYGEVRGARDNEGVFRYPKVNTENTYYIQPDTNLDVFGNLHKKDNKDNDRDNSNKAIDFNKKHLKEQYQYDDENGHHSLTFTQQVDGDVDGGGSVIAVTENGEATTEKVEETGDWRIYAGNTPILNAFLPDAEGYFSQKGNMAGIGSIQYGTAYDPLLTIINAATGTNQLKYGWDKLGISNAAGLVVYGAGLTLDNVNTSSGSGYFGGTIYADGALNINGVKNDIGIGSAADIYGSAVNIITDGKVTIYGDVTATGNTTNDVDNSEMKVEDAGNITINAGDVDVYGTLTSATTADYGNDVKIPGIEGTAVTWNPGNVSDPYAEMSDIADRFAHTTGKSNVNGNITINAGKDKDGNAIGGGNVNIYFGNQEQGLITTGGDLQVEATGNIFVDSDLDVGGNLKLTSTGKNSEILLTLTNIGKVQADKFTGVIENFLNGKNIADINASDLLKVIQEAYPGVEFTDEDAGRIVAALKKYEKSGNKASAIEQLNNDIAVAYMHQFMHNFDKTVEGSNKIYLNADSGNAKLTVDMWDYNHNKYYFEKYDTKFDEYGTVHTFKDELDNMDLHVNNDTAGVHAKASEYVYVEVSNGAQLKAIQQAGADALAYNYALMGDINASGVSGYEAIGAGSDTGFTGTFDGRGNRIIGLTVDKVDGKDTANAGIFDTIGTNGVVKDVNIYSGTFTGSDNAGAVAGVNNGRIEGIVTFGNTVTSKGNTLTSKGNAGGIVGVNNGNNGKIVTNEDGTITLEPVDDELPVTGIIDVESTGSVIAGGSSAVAGGLVGTNDGALGNSYSNSAVTANKGTGSGLGGVVGVNKGTVSLVDSLGVTNGTNSTNVGGVIGINSGTLSSAYNESIVNGYSNVGGIIGTNGTYTVNDDTITWTRRGTVSNIVNATSVTGEDESVDNVSEYVGGLVGINGGSIENGRNNGTITGTKYVGGMVGDNANANSILTNLVNDSSAEILGEEYVGGIAGSNSGTITADEKNDNLINRGSITGVQYVGGITGENKGTITNTNNDVELFVNTDKVTADKQAQYFGGVAGINQNGGIIKDATNTADVNAYGATYVGGVVGKNDGTLQDMAGNSGNVTGKNFVGGVAGQNNIALDGVNASNDGVVKATEGGAGGIFAENNADIINSTLTNNKIVAGGAHTGATGGIIGKNSGDITKTSLKNEVNGQVIGMNNVGGLIGENTGKIEGGRDDADSYYKYQIYNNGVINVGTWTDNDGDGIVDAGEIQGLAEGATSTNIGVLIGNNTTENGKTGSLTAGYNTGAINASGSTNVGGIVGNNAGKVDQVFNTVMTPEGEGAITGGNNVGGLIGTNSGTLSNAYNTTEVKPTNSGVVGNAVGENSGTITNIYASNTSGNLIGTGYDNGKVKNAYSFSNDDNDIENITVIAEDNRQNSDSYNGFDFDNTGATKTDETAASDGDKDYWKIYSGSGNPLLKVFLTTVTVDTDNLPDIVYNTKDQDLNIGSLTGTGGAFSAADDFKAYQNNNSLIQNTDFEHKNAGTYDNWLYSGQIASGSQEEGTFNPNNLGYDIEFKADIDKAQITVDLNQVDRVYGNTDIINGEYGFSYGFNNVLSDADKTALIDELNKNSVLNMNDVNAATDDKALVENGNKTNDAGSYDWTGTVNIAKNYQGNYEFVVKDTGTIDNGGATITTTGDSIVNKRQLSVSDIIANIVYGNQDGKGFIVSGGELIGVNGNAGIVYDDKVKLDTSLKVEDANIIAGSSYAENKGNRVTADAGKYENSLNFSGLALSGDDANNYVLVNDSFGGTIEVTQATIKVDLNDVDRTYGSTAFNSNGYGISNVQNNANGDIYTTGDFVVNVDTGDDGALTGDNSGRVTNDVGNYTYIGTVTSNKEKLNQNYNIVVNNSKEGNNIGSGVSTVTKADLSITINDVDTTYGTAFDESKYGYTLDNLANGDGNSSDIVNAIENAINNASGGYNNTGAADGTNGKVTQDAEGDYSLSFKKDITKEEILKNYNITTVTNGDANVSKKQISIGANDEEIHVGEVPVYTGTDINGVLVNGDKLSGDYHYGVADNAIESVVGKHNGVIGVWLNGTFYDLSLNTDWSKVSGLEFFSNYAVDYKPGTLTVTEQVMPDLPDNWPGNRWDYLFNDAPFDRNKNFRERKAEVNFVDGGMEV